MVEKVSIENLRKSALGARLEERKSLIISRKRKLQEIYATWGRIAKYESANMEEGEKRFLEENDLEKGRFFRESTLPPHSSYLPEPGGFSSPSSFQSGSVHAPKQSPPHAVLSPALVAPERPPQILENRAVPQEATLAEEVSWHPSGECKKSADLSLPNHVTMNGNRLGEGVDVPMTEENSSRTSESASPEKARSEAAALVVGGVPVLQESSTRIPDAERPLGVHPPPIPSELVNKISDSLPDTPEASIENFREASVAMPEPVITSSVAGLSGDSAKGIPDSFESSQTSSLSDAPPSPTPPKDTILELRQEPRPPATSSHPLQPSLAIITTQESRPLPIPSQETSQLHPHLDASSPTSSIDGGDARSTPGNVISSATSPDANHTTELDSQTEENGEQPKDLVPDSGSFGIVSLPVEEAEREELAGAFVGKKISPSGAQCEKPLPSVMVAEEIVEIEKESKLPAIPSQELKNEGESELTAVEAAAIAAIPVSETVSGSMETDHPPSPDPAAQLRLENSLARDDVQMVDSPVMHSREEDVEDQVQLVGINELMPQSVKPSDEVVKEKENATQNEMEVDVPPPTAEQATDVVIGIDGDVEMSGAGEQSTSPHAAQKQQNLGSTVIQGIDISRIAVDRAADDRLLTAQPLPLPSMGEARETVSQSDGAAVVFSTLQVKSEPAQSSDNRDAGNEEAPPAPPASDTISPQTSPRCRRELERKREKLAKVVISSTHHALAAAEEEAKRLQEDQISQGIIVVARRRDQQAASAAARGRSAVFQPGTKIDAITRYGIAEPPSALRERKKTSDLFDVLHTYKASGTSVADLLQRSSKTLSTSDHQIHCFESQAVRIESRIQELQDQGIWSLRQIPRVAEPRRKKCHWDFLLEEAKWLRDDFKGERRWKLAHARHLVTIVTEWHEAGEQRSKYMVDRKRYGVVPRGLREQRRDVTAADVDMVDQPTPDLVNGGASPGSDGDSPRDDMQEDDGWAAGNSFEHIGEPPAAIFTLSPEETVFSMPRTKAADDLLNQMPLYGPPKPPTERPEELEEEWTKLPIVAVTKYATGRMLLEEEQSGPPRKRSRYEYDENYDLFADDSDEDEMLSGGRLIGNERDKTEKPLPIPPEQTNVALFRPEYKPILQRLHTHVPRTTNDFLPPPAFFENRTPSLWLVSEDEMLKTLVREYHYNWGLISQCLTLEGMWHSGSERRSPWECFERWTSLEQVPQEFLKSPLFKPIQQRLDVAARVNGLYSNIPNPAGGNGAVKPRRGTQPIKVEKRRVTKYFTMMESMRKLAKKRETSVNKQQTNKSQVIAAMKRATESQSNNTNQLRTPQYFSLLKHDREQKDQKNMYNQHIQAVPQPRGGQGLPPQSRVAPHTGQHPGLPNGVQIASQQRVGLPAPQVPNGLSQAARPAPIPNGTNGVPMRSLPAQYQPRITPEQYRYHRMAAQQQQQVQQQQQQQHGGYQVSSTSQIPQPVVPNVHAMLHQAQQAALGQPQPQPKPRIVPPPLDAQAQQTSVPSPRMPPTPTTASTSHPKSQHLANVSVQDVAAIVQFEYPGLPQEQIQKATQQTLATYHAQISQNMQSRNPVRPNSMRAPTANTGPMIGVNGPVNPVNGGSPQMGQMASPRVTPTTAQPQSQSQSPQHIS